MHLINQQKLIGMCIDFIGKMVYTFNKILTCDSWWNGGDFLAKETVVKVYEAEKAADSAEAEARQRAEKIIEDAKISAEKERAALLSEAEGERSLRLEKAEAEGKRIIQSIEKNADMEAEKLRSTAKAKSDEAISAVIDRLF